MKLIFNDELSEQLENIFRAQEKPRFYLWCTELNDQFEYLEGILEGRGVELTVAKVRQNCDNLCLSVIGDADEVAWMDMALLVYGHNRRYKHLLVLEHMG